MKADSQLVARDMVSRYDKAVAVPDECGRMHRVAHSLLGSGTGQLGVEFRTWATDGSMSARLRSELTAYQMCMLDDSFVEGPHAQVGRVARRISVPSPSWWSATVRLEQNFREHDRAKWHSPGRVEELFHSWKLLAQSSRSAYLAGKPARLSDQRFLRSVYRIGREGMQRDCSALNALADSSA